MRACCCCGLVFQYGYGFGSHMLYHERRGEVTRTVEDGKTVWAKVMFSAHSPTASALVQ